MTDGFIRKTCLDMGHHPLIAELLEMLPPVDQPFNASKQEKWLNVAKAVFDLLYVPSALKAKLDTHTQESAAAEQPLPTLPPEPKRVGNGSEFLSQPQRHVLDALRVMEKQPGDWIAEPMRVIAQQAGISNTGIQAVIEALERKNLIKIDHRKGDGVNRYRVVAQPGTAA